MSARMLYRSMDGTLQNNSHWEWDINRWGKPVLAVDFHHTVTDACPLCLTGSITNPREHGTIQEDCREALTKLRQWFKILIFTGSGNFWNAKECQGIVDWLARERVPYDEIRFDKPPAAFIVDDRSLHHRSWQETLEELHRRTYSFGL